VNEHRAEPLPRVLAPIALGVAFVLFVGVVAGSIGGGGGGERESAAQREAEQAGAPPAESTREEGSREEPTTGRATYTVKTGDTLAGISRKTGVSVQRIQELNPDLDPQALVSGQQIKLR
jgi:LysM repeat protein